MANFTIELYRAEYYRQWNDFIALAKNATFLFHRDFMDYHKDRFDDFSLLVFDGQQLVAVMPANRVGDRVFSHQGLTYGGLVHREKLKLTEAIGIVQQVLEFLQSSGIQSVQVKMLPAIYHDKPADELAYALFLTNAELVRRDALSVLDLSRPYKFSKDRKQCIRRGETAGLEVREDGDFKTFWNEILIPNLERKHQVAPVHSLAEIEKLHQSFPENIRHFNVYHEGKLVAGTTVFVTKNVAHPQYISGQQDKNALGSLDFLYHYLITDVFKDVRFFDFGISNEQHGRKLNAGLAFWKESFGTGTLVQDFYEVQTANHVLLEHVLL
ncbi:BioF2-like acetyltransferase domain-containing protein [Flavobacterium longum]|uniref:GNAT family N-acetyltransferase n=1 Tax=Flavobacterium longum TaxID=1299340 RepID=UPI0039EBD96A